MSPRSVTESFQQARCLIVRGLLQQTIPFQKNRAQLVAQDGQLVTRMSYARVEVTIDTRTDSTSVNRRTTELSQQGNAR